jgi:hypothetical protein
MLILASASEVFLNPVVPFGKSNQKLQRITLSFNVELVFDRHLLVLHV